jgi:hypothetical protein
MRQLKVHVILRAVAGSTPAMTAALTPVRNALAGVDSATALRSAQNDSRSLGKSAMSQKKTDPGNRVGFFFALPGDGAAGPGNYIAEAAEAALAALWAFLAFFLAACLATAAEAASGEAVAVWAAGAGAPDWAKAAAPMASDRTATRIFFMVKPSEVNEVGTSV